MLSEKLTFLDCFCGLGGVSDGFAAEGFEILGIEYNKEVSKEYPYDCIVADVRTLNGKMFKGFDVIWGSPPCRDFSQIGLLYGKRWKNPPNPENGIKTIKCFMKFVEDAQPKIWIMENVANLKKYFTEIKPRTEGYITYGKKHVFYGNYPLFLMSRDMRIKIRCKNKNGRDQPNMKYLQPASHNNRVIQSRQHARIPLVCSQAFARACKRKLLEDSSTVNS